jgi:hypothetical protein
VSAGVTSPLPHCSEIVDNGVVSPPMPLTVVGAGFVTTPKPLLFVVPFGYSDSTSVLSYLQRHYDIYISNYSNFAVRVLKIYQVPPFHLSS